LSTAGNTLTINTAALTASIANQSKTYGADDPSLSGIAVGLSGQVNRTVTNWMRSEERRVGKEGRQGGARSNAMTRHDGERGDGGPYAKTAVRHKAVTGASSCNHTVSLSTAGNTLTINTAALTASIANQSKTYGADDPSLSGIAVGLSGQVNRTVTNWM